MLKAREAVRNLHSYRPPLAGREGLRLDFNESTDGCSPRVLERLKSLDPEILARYPEREPVEAEVARFLKLDPAQVLLTNGVDEGIHLLCSTYIEHGDEALVAGPTFAMYELFSAAMGARVVEVRGDDSFDFPQDELLAKINPRTRLIMIANPNNPTGTAVPCETLIRIARAAPDAAVLIDEAYFEFHGATVLDLPDRPANLFLARTFSKAYGLAGLRAGILAGASEQMKVVRRVASPYNVNAAALAVLPEAIGDQRYVTQYAATVQHNRLKLERELDRLGLHYWPSRANFVLVRVGPLHAEFVQSLRTRGILVRDRSTDPGCDGCVRLTVGSDAHARALLRTLPEVVDELELRREVRA